MKKYLLLFFISVASLTITAQSVLPITRFHVSDSPYTHYRNNFISGFMQHPSEAAPADSLNGFLQIPILGRPVWVYVGEKDSTQFTAYASGFRNLKKTSEDINVMLTRYGIKAHLVEKNGVLEQHYLYPDTTAEKGFLLDVDHVLGGTTNEDMDIKMIDRQNIRAYKRGYETQSPQMYYFAHFSQPYESYNIRKERVTLESGKKESRLKAVFTFLLQPEEELIVTSAVSSLAADAAYAMVRGHKPPQSFKDERRQRPQEDKPLLAGNTPSKHMPSAVSTHNLASQNNHTEENLKASAKRQAKRYSSTASQQSQANAKSHVPSQSKLADLIVVDTREASLKAAFYAALNHLLELPSFKKTRNVVEMMQKAVALSQLSPLTKAEANEAEVDSILRSFALGCLNGESLKEDTNGQKTAAFLIQSMGFLARNTSTELTGTVSATTSLILQRPLFNVITLYYPADKRFILHTKANAPYNSKVQQASWNGLKLDYPFILPLQQVLKGGVMAVKMGR